MCAHRRTWESGYTTHYLQWNHTRARSAYNQQRTTNHIALPSRQVSSLISNDFFNIDAPANGYIRLNTKYSSITFFHSKFSRLLIIFVWYIDNWVTVWILSFIHFLSILLTDRFGNDTNISYISFNGDVIYISCVWFNIKPIWMFLGISVMLVK